MDTSLKGLVVRLERRLRHGRTGHEKMGTSSRASQWGWGWFEGAAGRRWQSPIFLGGCVAFATLFRVGRGSG